MGTRCYYDEDERWSLSDDFALLHTAYVNMNELQNINADNHKGNWIFHIYCHYTVVEDLVLQDMSCQTSVTAISVSCRTSETATKLKQAPRTT